ncbi:hypothetical protein HY498_02695 [Candidatus Woesearchaeota archaeon]|nr:hypothetical protein [Candidatus Woesearchaeota archaeon]
MVTNYSLDDKLIKESQGLSSKNDFKVDSTYQKIQVLVNYCIYSLKGFNVDLRSLKENKKQLEGLIVPVHRAWKFYLDRAKNRVPSRKKASHMLALQGDWVDVKRYAEVNGEDFEKIVDGEYNNLVEKYSKD